MEAVLNSVEFESQFEEQVKLELINKKYESLSELLKWDKITEMSNI